MAAPAVPVGADAPIMEVMATMRAMRRLKPDPVPDELLDTLVEAATWAPSGGDLLAYSFGRGTARAQMARLAEPWRVICRWYLSTMALAAPDHMSEERYERLKDALRYQADHFHETPAVIVPCYEIGRMTKALRSRWRDFVAAAQTL